jgi:hypothetical protein
MDGRGRAAGLARLPARAEAPSMKHPEFLLLPVAMIADYLLTIASARLRERGHAEHFKTEHFELNPVWQATVAKKRWFNPRYLVLTLALSTILIACVEGMPSFPQLVRFFAGVLIGVQGSVIGRHLCNLATFLYVRRHPDSIVGMVTLQHEFVLWLSIFQHGALLFVTGTLAIYEPQASVLGVFAGVAMIALVHLIWIARFRRVARHRAAPPWPTTAQAGTGAGSPPASSTASGTNLPCPSSSANSPPSATSSA